MDEKKCNNPDCNRDADCSYHEKDNSWTWWCAECFERRFYGIDWHKRTCRECGYWYEGIPINPGQGECLNHDKIDWDAHHRACPDIILIPEDSTDEKLT